MKRKVVSMVVGVILLLSIITVPALAATEEDIEQSIQAGLDWLVPQQNSDGYWDGNWDELVASTGFAVVKLEERAFELGFDSPFDPSYEYSDNVIAGLDYIFSQAAGSFWPGFGICFGIGRHENYNTGIAMMAIAASRDPGRIVTTGPFEGLTYQEVLQENVQFFAWSQNPDGGWFCWANPPLVSDMPNTGYVALGLRCAEDFGCSVNQTLKDNLSVYIDYIQTNPGDPNYTADNDGGAGYMVPGVLVNLLKTGNLLLCMELVGDDMTSIRVRRALAYIERHWNDANDDPGWKGPPLHCQSAYCLMKGLESMAIETINVGGSDIDWFDEMSTILVNGQNPDGSWPPDYGGDSILATEWALLALEKIVLQTPSEATQDLISDVEDINLPDGIENSLISKLEGAIDSLDNGQENAAINKLNAFINQIEAQRGKKITDEQADELIATAQWIIDNI